MSLKKIRRRLSQTFRFSIESSLSELAEHLTIEESNGEVKNNGKLVTKLIPIKNETKKWDHSYSSFTHTGIHHSSTFTKNHRRLSLSHSRIIDVNHRPGRNNQIFPHCFNHECIQGIFLAVLVIDLIFCWSLRWHLCFPYVLENVLTWKYYLQINREISVLSKYHCSV